MEQIQALLVSKGGIVIGFAAVFLVLERLFPAAMCRVKAMAARMAKNASLFAFNALLSPLIVIPLSAFAAQWALDWRPEWWSGWTGLILDLLLLDLWIYWWHRANHEIQFLWRFHEVHHLDEFLDVTSAVRFHFGEVLLSALVRASVIFILAIPLTSVVIFETMVLLNAIFHHSNVKVPPRLERVLSWFIVTPSIHWIHHHAIRRDTDSNYANFLSVWDRIFGSRSWTVRTPDMKIGVETLADVPLLSLAIRPFRKDRY
jgi:sterol desaturase/sphingolipid hydroxylase (fatty acid hydroxylase superfamily)